MIVCEKICPIQNPRGTAVALGYFDGVHLGHRAVLGTAVRYAAAHGLAPAAFTFALPPSGGFKGRRILAPAEKQRRIASLGVEYYLRPPFAAFCDLSPRAFVFEMLQKDYGARAVFCGDNFTFGKDKAGDVNTLRALCAEAGIEVVLVPMAQYDGGTVSSTRIRAALAEGRIEDVNAMLGEAYRISLPVQHGQKLGRTLGFPTINQIYPEGMQLPKCGVYITRVFFGTESGAAGVPGATGLGTRPTVGGENVTCETFIPGFSGEIYGDVVTLEFCSYLKPTVKFDGVQALQAYIQSAAESALAYFDAPRGK